MNCERSREREREMLSEMEAEGDGNEIIIITELTSDSPNNAK